MKQKQILFRSNNFDSLVEHSYQLLAVFAHFNYTSYLNPMILNLLHLLYWRETSHPALSFIQSNPICLNKEIGEMSLSLLANKLSATKVGKDFQNLRNDFLGLSSEPWRKITLRNSDMKVFLLLT